jgi:hypothetical protein
MYREIGSSAPRGLTRPPGRGLIVVSPTLGDEQGAKMRKLSVVLALG